MRTTQTLVALVACALVAPTAPHGWPTLSESRRDGGEIVSTSPNVPSSHSADSRRDSATRSEEHTRELFQQLGMPVCGASAVLLNNGFLIRAENHNIIELRALGEAVHPVVERAIASPGTPMHELRGIGAYLSEVPAGREKFRATIVRRLRTPDLIDTDPVERAWIRRELCEMLSEFGTEREAHALVPLLTSENHDLQRCAARALARIGGANEAHALSAWLARQHPGDLHLPRLRAAWEEFARRLASE